MDQLMFALARVGSTSVRVTPLAVPIPSLVTTIVKPTGLPARTVGASGTLVTVVCGVPVTQTPVWEVAVPAVLLVAVTELFRLVWKVVIVIAQTGMVTPLGGAVVPLVTWTAADAPWARSPMAQDCRTSVGTAPVIPQVPGPA